MVKTKRPNILSAEQFAKMILDKSNLASIAQIEEMIGVSQFKIDTSESPGGTSLQNSISVKYSDLVLAFGEPREADLHKVSGQWNFIDDSGHRYTIYDWKKTSLYGTGYPSVAAMRAFPDNQSFNVGGMPDGNTQGFIAWVMQQIARLG